MNAVYTIIFKRSTSFKVGNHINEFGKARLTLRIENWINEHAYVIEMPHSKSKARTGHAGKSA